MAGSYVASPCAAPAASLPVVAREADVAALADRLDVPAGPEGLQAANLDPSDLVGNVRRERHGAVACLEPEHRANEEQWCAGGPRLRAARGGIRDREPCGVAVVPGERLGQAVVGERRGIEQRERDPVRFVAEPVLREAVRD